MKLKTNIISNQVCNKLMRLYNEGALPDVLEMANRLAVIFPNSPSVLNVMGSVNFKSGHYKSSIKLYKKAIWLRPDFAEAHNNLGFALDMVGKKNTAITSYIRAIELKPEYEEAYSNLGSALNKLRFPKQAISNYKRAIHLQPNYPEAHNDLGLLLDSLAKHDNAIGSFTIAIKLRPDFLQAHINLASTLTEIGKNQEAINVLKIAIKLDPNNEKVHYQIGLALYTLGEYKTAEVHFRASHFDKSQYYLLRCQFLRGEQGPFYEQLNQLINQNEIHPMIGSLGCRAAIRFGQKKLNLFCSNPMDHFLKLDLLGKYDFKKTFQETTVNILSNQDTIFRSQGLLSNGQQTTGNIFSQHAKLLNPIAQIIHREVQNYKYIFSNSVEGFIKHWPKQYTLLGWILNMSDGCELKPHMHDEGWISGCIYISVPPKRTPNDGNLVICMDNGEQLTGSESALKKIIDVTTGTLCFFPSSLLHYTLPFKSEEPRIVLAFDIVPKTID